MDWFLYDRNLRHDSVSGSLWKFMKVNFPDNHFSDFFSNSKLKLPWKLKIEMKKPVFHFLISSQKQKWSYDDQNSILEILPNQY